jgi:serine/threonine protein kinase
VINSLAVGSRVAGFEIVAPLRAGGMASFYLARRVGPAGFSKPVGIKVIHGHLASDRGFVEMFLDEARLCARIVHPNVVHVEELGESEGMFFLAMEYVHGASLSALLRRLAATRRRLAPEVACAIARGVADGLHAAHEAKDEHGNRLEVVHRDVSPQNVLISAQGHVKLIDFGVAKARGRLQETESGALKGKLAYMSPEQAWGRRVDRRSDVYALGVVLWEMLTGRRLFAGANEIEILDRVRDPLVPPPSHFDPAIGPELDHVVLTALSSSPEGRFDTAQAFRRAIGNACPPSLAVEPDSLGALLDIELGDELARERALLAAFGRAVIEPPRADADVAARLSTTLASPSGRSNLAAAHPVLGAESLAPGPPSIPSTTVRNVARATATSEPTDPGAVTRSDRPAARKADRRKALAIAGAVLAATAVAGSIGVWRMGWLSPPRPMCEGVGRLTPEDGAPVSYRVDTESDASPAAAAAFPLGHARARGADPAPTALLEYVVPGTGPRRVELTTVNAGTSEEFDTLIAVFPGACSDALPQATPRGVFDDPEGGGGERRTRGSVDAEGGEILTFVLTAYGGGGELDDGPMQLDLVAHPR